MTTPAEVHAARVAQAELYGGSMPDRLQSLAEACEALHAAAERLRDYPSARAASELAGTADAIRQSASRAAFAIARSTDDDA